MFIIAMQGVLGGSIQSIDGKLGNDQLVIQLCGTCTFNNVTSLTTPNNGSILLNDLPMSQSGTQYTYLINKGNFTIPGIYIVNGIGDKDGILDPWAYKIYMSKSGETLETSESILYILILVGSFLLFIFFFYFAIAIPFYNEKTIIEGKNYIVKINKSKYLKLLSIWFAHGFFVWFLTLLLGIANNFLNLQITLNLLNAIYILFYTLLWANTILILSLFVIFIYKDILINKEILKYGKSIVGE